MIASVGLSTANRILAVETPAPRMTMSSLREASTPRPIRAPPRAAKGSNSCTLPGMVHSTWASASPVE